MGNQRKIVNDPVFGFIQIPTARVYEVLGHRWVQRLARIRQLGVSFMVYPGAQHTRLQHSMGAMHLAMEAAAHLETTGVDITPEEKEGLALALLLHDVGHAPFSHLLENTLVEGVHHEEITLEVMRRISAETGGALDLAMDICKGVHPKRFLHQLVSGQLDMDRMDYLRRDCFYTGVNEGTIGSARLIKMLRVAADGRLVIEEKGIYSMEQFLIARRLMYMQVYFHKTSVAAERMMLSTLHRAMKIAREGREVLFGSPSLRYFLERRVERAEFFGDGAALEHYMALDDSDVFCALKVWAVEAKDEVLRRLSGDLMNRRLWKMKVQDRPFGKREIEAWKADFARATGYTEDEAASFCAQGTFGSDTYLPGEGGIGILLRNGDVKDLAEVSDMLRMSTLSKEVKKYFFCGQKV